MILDNLPFLIPLGALLVASGTVSGSETAFYSLSPGRIAEWELRGSRLQRLVANLIARDRTLLLTILITNNAINIAYFALASLWASQQGGGAFAGGVVTVGALATLIIFGEILPKVIASSRTPQVTCLTAPVLYLLSVLLRPVTALGIRLLGRWIEERELRDGSAITGDEIKLVLEQSRQHGVVSQQVHDRLVEVVDLARVPVWKAMTHRVDCPTVRAGGTMDEAVEALREKPSPYLLVMDEREDCVGLLLAQDVLRGGRIAKRMRKPLFIPEGAQLSQAAQLFQESRTGVGVVVDEYGGTLGLCTLAHIANDLLGDGESEDLPEQAQPEQIDEHRWRLPGTMPLEEWRPLLGIDADNCATLGGFVCRQLEAIPVPGDKFLYDNLLFQVEEVDGGRIRTLVMERLSRREARRITREMEPGR